MNTLGPGGSRRRIGEEILVVYSDLRPSEIPPSVIWTCIFRSAFRAKRSVDPKPKHLGASSQTIWQEVVNITAHCLVLQGRTRTAQMYFSYPRFPMWRWIERPMRQSMKVRTPGAGLTPE